MERNPLGDRLQRPPLERSKEQDPPQQHEGGPQQESQEPDQREVHQRVTPRRRGHGRRGVKRQGRSRRGGARGRSSPTVSSTATNLRQNIRRAISTPAVAPPNRYTTFLRELRNRLKYPWTLGATIFRMIKQPFQNFLRGDNRRSRSAGDLSLTPPSADDRYRRATSGPPTTMFASFSTSDLCASYSAASLSSRSFSNMTYRPVPTRRRYGRYSVNLGRRGVLKGGVYGGISRRADCHKMEMRRGFFGRIYASCADFFDRPELMMITGVKQISIPPRILPFEWTPPPSPSEPGELPTEPENDDSSEVPRSLVESDSDGNDSDDGPPSPKRRKTNQGKSKGEPAVLVAPQEPGRELPMLDTSVPGTSRIKSYQSARLFVSNLSDSITSRDLFNIFKKTGRIRICTVHYNTHHASQCTGTVQFCNRRDARRAMHKFNGRRFQGKRIFIEISIKVPPPWLTADTPLRVFVTRVHAELNDLDLHHMFALSGEIHKVSAHYSRKRGKHLETADVKFKYAADAFNAVREYNGYVLLDKILRLEVLVPLNRESMEIPPDSRQSRKRRRSRSVSSFDSDSSDEEEYDSEEDDDSICSIVRDPPCLP